MAHLYRLIALVALLFVGHAHALIPKSMSGGYTITGSLPLYATTAEVCNSYTFVPFNDGSKNGYCDRINASPVTVYWVEDLVCPANSTPSGSQCACNSGFVEQGNQCVAGASDEDKLRDYCAGQNLSAKVPVTVTRPPGYPGGTPDVGFACSVPGYPVAGDQYFPPTPMFPGTNKGCLQTVQLDWGGQTADGGWNFYGSGKNTGGVCTPGAVNADTDPKQTPAENTPTDNSDKSQGDCKGYVGTVNGVKTCVPHDTTTGVGDTSSTTKSDGSTTETKTSTTCDGSKCTTTSTTTGKDSNGNSTGTSTSTTVTPQPVYCAQKPKDGACTGASNGGTGGSGNGGDGDEEGSSFGGSCTAGFTCDGDAIQCAIAREQHKRSCELFVNETDESKLYAAEAAKGRNRDVTADLPGNSEVDVSSKLDKSNLLGTASCIQDLSIVVWGKAVSLPMSKICPVLGYLGYVLVLVASLAAFRIVSGANREA